MNFVLASGYVSENMLMSVTVNSVVSMAVRSPGGALRTEKSSQ